MAARTTLNPGDPIRPLHPCIILIGERSGNGVLSLGGMGGQGGERNRVLSSRGRGARLEFYRGAFLGHSWGSRTLPSSSSGTDFVNTCFQGISPPTPKTVGEARRRLPHVSACHHFRTSRAQSLVLGNSESPAPPTFKTVGEAHRRLPPVSACRNFRTSRAQSLVWAIRYQLT